MEAQPVVGEGPAGRGETVGTSAYTAGRYPAEVVAYMKDHGRSKVIFGSNHQFWPAPDCLAGLAELDLDEGTHQLFLAENARRAFRLDGVS